METSLRDSEGPPTQTAWGVRDAIALESSPSGAHAHAARPFFSRVLRFPWKPHFEIQKGLRRKRAGGAVGIF